MVATKRHQKVLILFTIFIINHKLWLIHIVMTTINRNHLHNLCDGSDGDRYLQKGIYGVTKMKVDSIILTDGSFI